jgi:nicotinamidase-related amidase
MKTIQGKQVFDTLEELVAAPHTAVVAIDIQNDFCHPEGHFARAGKQVAHMAPAVDTMVSFVNAAQQRGVPVIFVRQQTLPGGHSDSPSWLRFKTRDGKSPEYTLPGSFGAEFVQGLEPGANDTVVNKFRSDAFVGTCLDNVLKARGILTLVMLGTTTEGCVESTVRAGSYHDYYVVVLKDAVAGPNKKLHENSLEFFQARYPLHSAQEVLAAMDASRGKPV